MQGNRTGDPIKRNKLHSKSNIVSDIEFSSVFVVVVVVVVVVPNKGVKAQLEGVWEPETRVKKDTRNSSK